MSLRPNTYPLLMTPLSRLMTKGMNIVYEGEYRKFIKTRDNFDYIFITTDSMRSALHDILKKRENNES